MNLTEAEIAALTERFLKEHQRGRVRLLTPLPLRTRLRLACHHARNSAGIWLVGHDRLWAARKLWRIR